MPYIENSNNIFIGNGTPAGTIKSSGATSKAPEASVAANYLWNPTLAGAVALYGKDIPPFRNELNQFASYAPVFTLGCLTNIELNFPLTYRVLGPAVKIIRSGGRGGPTIPTIYDIGGKVEYFIEDVEIQNHVAPSSKTRHSNATHVRFKVIEPYSMGQFFHSLRTASLVTGHSNYIEAPFLLSTAFIGYDDDGNVKSSFFSQRHFPIRIIKADMSVSEGGAVYEVEAVPYNEMASTDRTAAIKTDITAKGNTVAQVLQTGVESVTSAMNKLTKKQEDAFQTSKGDVYVIQFPNSNDLSGLLGTLSSLAAKFQGSLNSLQAKFESVVGKQGAVPAEFSQYLAKNTQTITTRSLMGDKFKTAAETDINEIGLSPIVKPGATVAGGNSPMQQPSLAQSKKIPGTIEQGKLQIDATTQEFNFKGGTSVPRIIEEVILSSEFGAQIIDKTPDATGRYKWFRIHTQVYNDGGLLGGLFGGETPKVYVYRVQTYKVDESTVAAPGQSLSSNLIKQALAAKAYSYIYTGQNDDIIDFDLNFNLAFFSGIPAARSQQNLFTKLGGAFALGKNDKEAVPVRGGAGSFGENGSNPLKDVHKSSIDNVGGGGTDDTRRNAAKYFNDMVINTSNDMIGVDLKIHGDPYFLCDSGIGNWIGLPSFGFSPINLDGTMNPINGEVHIVLNFRTPVDYDDEDGYVKYPLGGFLPIAMFSGVYQVVSVENNFVNGKFEQTLKLIRKRNQDFSLESIAGSIISSLLGVGKKALNKGSLPNQLTPNANDQAPGD